MKRKVVIFSIFLLVIVSLGVLAGCESTTSSNNLDTQYQQALDNMSEGKYDEAIEVLKGLLEKDNTYTKAKVLLADVNIEKKDFNQAKLYLYDVIDNGQGDEQAYRKLSKILADNKNIDESIAILNDGYIKLKNQELKNSLDKVIKERVIRFHDRELEKLVRAKINKSYEEIYQSDLLDIKELYLYGLSSNTVNENDYKYNNIYYYKDINGNSYNARGKVNDLRDLKYFLNLEKATFAYQHVTTIPDLSNLHRLSYINLNRNYITDLDSLQSMKQLEVLNLSFNGLTNLTPLNKLTNLKLLNLVGNKKLKEVKDLTPLVNIEELYLGSTGISTLADIKDMLGLQILDVSDTKIRDFSPLESMHNLTNVNLRLNSIKTLPSFKELSHLQEIDISNNEIADLRPLSTLKDIRIIRASNNKVKSIPTLEGWKNLTYLSLAYNSLEDIQGLSGLTKLTHLYLSGNRITNVSPLINISSLEQLSLSNNEILDASPLRNLKNLEYLTIAENDSIKNLNVLLDLEKLDFIDTSYSLIKITGNIPSMDSISSGNLSNLGFATSDGSYIYYQYISYGDFAHPKLYRRNVITNEDEEISGEATELVIKDQKPGGDIEEDIYYLNIQDDKLYFYSDGANILPGIMVMNKDGSNRKLLKEGNFSNLEVLKDTVYYLDNNKYIGSMKLDGSEEQLILEIPVTTFYVIDKSIYYVPENNPNLLKYDMLTGDFITIINEDVKNPIILKDNVFYINQTGNIISFNLSTNEMKQIGIDIANTFNVNNKYIFYSDDVNHFLYRMDIDGKNRQLIYDHVEVSSINILGDYIFFMNKYGDLLKIKNDGTELENLSDYY